MDDCFADEYKKMNGRVLSAGDYGRDSTSFVLASGAAIRPMVVDGARLLNVGVDKNEKKGPNIQGRDLFWLYVYSNGLIDDIGASAPLSEEDRDNAFTANCSGDGSAAGCFGKILNDNWEMTY